MQAIDEAEAQRHFYRLLKEVERGESILIVRGGRVIARMEPVEESEERVGRGRRQVTSSANAGRRPTGGRNRT